MGGSWDAEWAALDFHCLPEAATDFGGTLSVQRLQRSTPSPQTEELFYTRIGGSVTREHAQDYLRLYQQYVEYHGQHGQDFALCYDFREVGWPVMLGLLSHLDSVIKVHHALAAMYRCQLQYTVILLQDPNFASLLNGIMRPLYTPIRPLHIAVTLDTAAAFVQSVREGKAPAHQVDLPLPP